MKKFGILSLIILSACNTTWGPHPLNLDVSEGFTLTSTKGEQVEFASESQSQLLAFYSSSRKMLTVQRVGMDGKKQSFEFKKVVSNEGEQSMRGDQLQTGQNLGIEVKQTLLGQEVREEEYWRSCTYFVSRPEQICYPTEHQGYRCYTRWEQVPVSGQERVRERITDRSYSVEGRVFQSIGTLGQISGNYENSQSDFTALSACR